MYLRVVLYVPDTDTDNDPYDMVEDMANVVKDSEIMSYDVSDKSTEHETWLYGGDRIEDTDKLP